MCYAIILIIQSAVLFILNVFEYCAGMRVLGSYSCCRIKSATYTVLCAVLLLFYLDIEHMVKQASGIQMSYITTT